MKRPHPSVRPAGSRRPAGVLARQISRRGALQLGAASAMAGFALPLLPRAAAATPAGLIAETLVEPEVCASVDGLLETTLECSVTNVDIGGSPAVSNVY